MDPLKPALNLFRRLPTEDTESTFQSLATLREDLADELLQHIDFPLKVGYDSKANKPFILSDFNCWENSYRSPWTNEYFPAVEDGFYLSSQIRKLEETANFLFSKYTEMYYDDALSSVYLWENGNHICGCFLIYKTVPRSKRGFSGSWHSIHIVEIIPDEVDKAKAEYRLTTSIQLYLTVKNAEVGEATQNGSLTRQASQVMKFEREEDHITNIGQMIEQMENFIRQNLDSLYISKSQNTIDGIRILHPSSLPKRSLLAELSKNLHPREE